MVHIFTLPLKFFLSFLSIFREVPVDIQLRQRLSFDSSSSRHQTAFNQVIGSGFPRLFLEHSPNDHFCAPCSCLFTFSHILRCFCHGFVSVVYRAVKATLPAASSISFCTDPRLSSCFSSSFLITAFWTSIFALSFLGLHPVHCFLLSPCRVVRGFILLYHGINRVVVPGVPYFSSL